MIRKEFKTESEVSRCLLCHDALCTKVCIGGEDPATVIRSMRFDNELGAAACVGKNACADCSAPCVDACIRGKADRPVEIPFLLKTIAEDKKEAPDENGTADLSVTFCGVKCENPFFLSSSIVGSNDEMVAKAFEMGWAGVAFKTIGVFRPEEASPRFSAISKEDTPFVGFKNIEQISDHPLAENLEYLRRLKRDYPTKVIIASIMGQNEEEWEMLARECENAGADIIECNFSCPQMAREGLGSDVGTNPELVAAYTAAVRRGTSLPILAKMTPNITSVEPAAEAAMEAGADGIAAINTVKSIMNVDLDTFVSEPKVSGKSAVGGYSGKAVKPIALRFISDLSQDKKLTGAQLSGMGGIETWRDAAEFIALGCGTVQITTAVMQYGYRIIDDLIDGLSRYLTESGIGSVSNLLGRSVDSVVSADELDRSSVEYPLFDRSSCIGCGRCYLSCYDGGHQAIVMDDAKHTPIMDPKKCVGCQLCRLVCPVGAIGVGKRIHKK